MVRTEHGGPGPGSSYVIGRSMELLVAGLVRDTIDGLTYRRIASQEPRPGLNSPSLLFE
jgi:hypothetical protein